VYLARPIVFRDRNICVYMKADSEGVETATAFEISCLFILFTTSAPKVYFLSHSPSLVQTMADKRKARGTKSGQRKFARRDTGSLPPPDSDVVADKENSQTPNARLPVTFASERPRPRPIKKSTVATQAVVPASEHADSERSNLKPASERDEGAAMAVEALLSIRNGKSSPATNLPVKARGSESSPMEHTGMEHTFRVQQVVPGYGEDSDDLDIQVFDPIENLNDIIVDQPEPEDETAKSSDEDGMGCATSTTWINLFLTVSYSDNGDSEQIDQLHALFDVPFEVPFEGATRNLSSITSHTSFNEFLSAVAKRMETRLSLLARIAYIPSYKPKNPKPVPKLLEDDDDWEKLLVDVEEYRTGCIAKCKGKGTVKQFVIVLVDMSGVDGKSDPKKVRALSMPFKLSKPYCILRLRRKQRWIQLQRFPPVRRSTNYSVNLRRNTCAQHVTNRAMSYQMASTTYTACRISLRGLSYL
jgi:hypothetical protein